MTHTDLSPERRLFQRTDSGRLVGTPRLALRELSGRGTAPQECRWLALSHTCPSLFLLPPAPSAAPAAGAAPLHPLASLHIRLSTPQWPSFSLTNCSASRVLRRTSPLVPLQAPSLSLEHTAAPLPRAHRAEWDRGMSCAQRPPSWRDLCRVEETRWLSEAKMLTVWHLQRSPRGHRPAAPR